MGSKMLDSWVEDKYLWQESLQIDLNSSLSTTSIMNCQLLRQKLSNNLSNEIINTGVSVVFKTKSELKCQNELFLKYHFSGNTSVYVFIMYWDYLTNFIRNNWRSMIDVVERFGLCLQSYYPAVLEETIIRL
jgi:hypothetical protein